MAQVQAPENRVIAHFDIDCFYAQSEELRCPSLRGRPVGVTQKFLVVTCNYVARGLGVPKMVSIAEAKKMLPALVLVNGEDLTPYRADNKRIMAVLRRYGTVEKLGLDEGTVDITAQVQARLQCGHPTLAFSGHVLGLETMVQINKEHQNRPLLNIEEKQLNYEQLPLQDVLLLLGSQVVAEMRTALERETGFHCSCGIAQNKMLAKLSSSLNKPNMQTCLLRGAVFAFLSPLSVRKIPGVGKQMQGVLSDLGVETIADLREVTLKQLSERLGDRVALFLFNACRGEDPAPVQDKGPPKSISVEDSFKNCKTLQNVEAILGVLAPDLIRRLDEDREETGRRPKSFTVKWRIYGSKWSFSSVSTQMPQDLLAPLTPIGQRAFLTVEVAMKLLSRSLGQDFHLAGLNIGATNFVSESATISPAKCDIRAFLHGQVSSGGKELNITSKRDARARRESFKAMVDNKPAAEALLSCFDRQDGTVKAKSQREHGDGWNDPEAEGYYLSNSSEEEEKDDLEELLKLPRQQNSLRRKVDSNTMASKHIPTSSFHDCQNVNLVHPRLSTLGMDLSYRFPLSPQNRAADSWNVEKISSTTSLAIEADVMLDLLLNAPQERFSVGSQPPFEFQNLYSSTVKDEVDRPKDVSIRVPVDDVTGEASSIVHTTEDSNANLVPSPCSLMHSSIFGQDSTHSKDEPGKACSMGTGVMPVGVSRICEECGEPIEDSDIARQEHADYHFALILDLQERHSNPQEAPESSGVVPSAKRGKLAYPSSGTLKKLKSRDGPLDRFVLRRR